jgi:hypothetical protein
MALVVKSVQRANTQQPAEEAQALGDSINFGGTPGRLVQIIESQQPGFLLAIFEEV